MTEVQPDGPDDVALVQDVVRGSFDALASLYDRHAAAIFAVASRLTRDRGVAEEVVQDTFLALWDRAESFDPAAASLGTWLHAIARNRTIDRLRAAGRRPRLVDLSDGGTSSSDSEALERAAGDGWIVAGATAPPSPDAAFAAKETRGTIEAAIGGLDADERIVIVLAYRDELSQSEIAERLGWPLGTVKTRTRRALRRLRVAIEAQAGSAAPVGEDRG